MKLYMVIVETCIYGYGAKPKCMGVFDNKEAAEHCKENYKNELKKYISKIKVQEDKDELTNNFTEYLDGDRFQDPYFMIQEIDLNKEYPVAVPDKDTIYCGLDTLEGGVHLGGYIE